MISKSSLTMAGASAGELTTCAALSLSVDQLSKSPVLTARSPKFFSPISKMLSITERNSAGKAASTINTLDSPGAGNLFFDPGALESVFDVTAAGEQFLAFVSAVDRVTINVNAHQFPSILPKGVQSGVNIGVNEVFARDAGPDLANLTPIHSFIFPLHHYHLILLSS